MAGDLEIQRNTKILGRERDANRGEVRNKGQDSQHMT